MTREFIIIIGLSVITLLSVLWQVKTELRLKKILRGKGAADLEDTLVSLINEVDSLKDRERDMVAIMENIDNRVKTSIRGVELLRFNPFEDAGSNQSFAVALMNEHGNGVILSSLYSRDRMSIFAKPVQSHGSPFELTTEEREVMNKAKV